MSIFTMEIIISAARDGVIARSTRWGNCMTCGISTQWSGGMRIPHNVVVLTKPNNRKNSVVCNTQAADYLQPEQTWGLLKVC